MVHIIIVILKQKVPFYKYLTKNPDYVSSSSIFLKIYTI